MSPEGKAASCVRIHFNPKLGPWQALHAPFSYVNWALGSHSDTGFTHLLQLVVMGTGWTLKNCDTSFHISHHALVWDIYRRIAESKAWTPSTGWIIYPATLEDNGGVKRLDQGPDRDVTALQRIELKPATFRLQVLSYMLPRNGIPCHMSVDAHFHVFSESATMCSQSQNIACCLTTEQTAQG